jgi:hypothetical protein
MAIDQMRGAIGPRLIDLCNLYKIDLEGDLKNIIPAEAADA